MSTSKTDRKPQTKSEIGFQSVFIFGGFGFFPISYTDNVRNISTEKRHKSAKKRIQKQTSAFGKCPLFFLYQWATCAKSGNRTQKKADNHFCATFCAAYRMSTFFVYSHC
jgi:hypothetical protein